MILKDSVRDLILKMDVFMTKRGRDVSIQKEQYAVWPGCTGCNLHQ